MEAFLRPPTEVLVSIAFKKYVYLEALILVSGLRWLFDSGLEKRLALTAFLLSAIGLFALFGIGFFEIYSGPVRRFCLWWSRFADGTGMLLTASLPLALAAFRLNRRHRWTDGLHAILLATLITLWWMTM